MILTIEEVKAHLRIQHDEEDELIDGFRDDVGCLRTGLPRFNLILFYPQLMSFFTLHPYHILFGYKSKVVKSW